MLRTSCLVSAVILILSFRVFAEGVDAVEVQPVDDSEQTAPADTNTTPVEAVTPPSTVTPPAEEAPPPPPPPETKKKTSTSEELKLDQEMSNLTPPPSNNSGNESLEPVSSGKSKGGQVVVESQTDYTLDYQHRRTRHGFIFDVTYEDYYPFNYQSQFGDKYIEDIVGKDNAMKLIGAELGYKFNFSFASASALFAYGKGSIDGKTAGESLSLTKQAIEFNIAIDAFFSEPWVVPYAQVGMHQFSIEESRTSGSKSAAAGYALNYRYGLLFQLDWIDSAMDKDAKAERLRSSGLENTFIDVYYAQYEPSSNAQDPATLGSDGDPNLGSNAEMGLGLKLEF
ncbi:MAG: hypothetical protein ACXVAX_08020 [Pseudobdellovibrio sp.]